MCSHRAWAFRSLSTSLPAGVSVPSHGRIRASFPYCIYTIIQSDQPGTGVLPESRAAIESRTGTGRHVWSSGTYNPHIFRKRKEAYDTPVTC